MLGFCGADDGTRTRTLTEKQIFVPPDFRRRLMTFVVWTVPSPLPEGFRRRPSSLYTFPEGAWLGIGLGYCPLAFPDFERFYSADFPAGTPILKFAASTDFATSAFFAVPSARAMHLCCT